MVISKYCYKLSKLFLHCNEFIKNEEFNHSKNRLENLKLYTLLKYLFQTTVLTIMVLYLFLNLLHSLISYLTIMVLSLRIGQHEMDEARYVTSLVQFLLEDGHSIEEVYFLFVCRGVNDKLFMNLLIYMKVFVYDAPRRNRNLPVIPMSTDIAFHLIEECPSLNTIGNMISWQVADWEG
ncbi:hypothetical protein Avbf_05990 [Armadillidium vulgare]|nr:hypothetical protein Avbf_05990 [Armadillidium vulgare]